MAGATSRGEAAATFAGVWEGAGGLERLAPIRAQAAIREATKRSISGEPRPRRPAVEIASTLVRARPPQFTGESPLDGASKTDVVTRSHCAEGYHARSSAPRESGQMEEPVCDARLASRRSIRRRGLSRSHVVMIRARVPCDVVMAKRADVSLRLDSRGPGAAAAAFCAATTSRRRLVRRKAEGGRRCRVDAAARRMGALRRGAGDRGGFVAPDGLETVKRPAGGRACGSLAHSTRGRLRFVASAIVRVSLSRRAAHREISPAHRR